MSAGSRLRVAGPEDDEALVRFHSAQPMQGEVALVQRRDPRFFAFYEIQRGTASCWVSEREGRIVAAGTVFVRDGWLDGAPAPVGYLGDLRLGFGASRERLLPRRYGEVLARVRERTGCRWFLTAVLTENRAARRALVERSGARSSQPGYTPFRRFSMVNLWLAGPRRATPAGLRVRRARAEDLDRVARFLDRDHRRRPFGYRYDTGELAHRLAAWPGYTIDSLRLVEDGRGRLRGCAGLWDPGPIKRYRVLRYPTALRWQVRLAGWLGPALGGGRLPREGEDLRTRYLTDLAAREDDPRVLRALLANALDEERASGAHFLACALYENDPLAPALRGFRSRRLGFDLYVVGAAGDRPPAWSGRPGFEMALA